MIALPIPPDESRCHGGAHSVGYDHSQPDTVQVQRQREEQRHSAPKQEGAQEGNQCGHAAVAQGGKEGGAIDAEAYKKVAQGEDAEAVDRHLQQLGAVSHEGRGQGSGQRLGQGHHGKGGQRNYRHAFAKDVFQLLPVVRPKVEADNRPAAHGEAQKDGGEGEIHIHHHRVGRHTKLPDDAHELEIEQDADHRGGQVAHQLGGAVGTGVFQFPPIEPGPAKPQGSSGGSEEVQQREQPAHGVAEHRPPGRPGDAHVQRADENIVHDYVGGSGGQREEQACFGQFGGDEKDLKGHLEHEYHAASQQDAAVGNTVVHQQVAASRQPGDGPDEQCASYGEYRPQPQHHQNDHREVAVSQLGFTLAHSAGHHGAAAGTQHEAGGGQDHGHGENDIYRRQCVLSHQIGDKQAVYHAVDRSEDHHDNRGQSKAEQLAVCEVVGKFDLHRRLFLLRMLKNFLRFLEQEEQIFAFQGQQAGPFRLGQTEEGPLLRLQHRADGVGGQIVPPGGEAEKLFSSRAAGELNISLLLQLLQAGVDRLLAEGQIAAQLRLGDGPLRCLQDI